MIRSLAGVCVIIILRMALAAPVDAESKWEKGVKAGISVAKLTGWGSGFTGHRAGLSAGGFLARTFSENFALQGEALYVMKGGKETHSADAIFEMITVTYLEVPILCRLIAPLPKPHKPGYTSRGTGSRVNFYFGPIFSFKLSSDGDIDEGIPFQATSFDRGVALGAAFDIDFKPGKKIVVDARYTRSMDTIGDYEPELEILNSVLTLMIGYAF